MYPCIGQVMISAMSKIPWSRLDGDDNVDSDEDRIAVYLLDGLRLQECPPAKLDWGLHELCVLFRRGLGWFLEEISWQLPRQEAAS